MELQYQNIPRLLLAEEYLGDEILDYKFFVFKGSVQFIQVDVDRHTHHKRCFFNVDWKKLPFGLKRPIYHGHVERPSKLNDMIQICESIGKDIPFFRIDLYFINNSIYFGEITLSPESGYGQFSPIKYDALCWQYFNGLIDQFPS